MNGLNSTLASLGVTMDSVVKTIIFMTNVSDFSTMNSVYVPYFTVNSTLPARSTVQVIWKAIMILTIFVYAVCRCHSHALSRVLPASFCASPAWQDTIHRKWQLMHYEIK